MQLVCLYFKKPIYKDETPTDLIEPGDTVQVRLRVGCGACVDIDDSLPSVPEVANGCDNLATLSANSTYVLATQTPIACVGEVVPLVVESVTSDGKGFCFDRTAASQDFRGSDIDMVMPDHDGLGCEGEIASPV